MLKVINLFGAPGVGKSGTRGGLYWLMKCNHFSVEEVQEFAKELILKGAAWSLQEEQLRIFAEQNHRQHICARAGYEYAVSDSPLHLSEFYAPEGYLSESLAPVIDQAYSCYTNYNFLLTRDERTPEALYESRGRVHSLDMNAILEARMRNFLRAKELPFVELTVDTRTPWEVLKRVCPNVEVTPPAPAAAERGYLEPRGH